MQQTIEMGKKRIWEYKRLAEEAKEALVEGDIATVGSLMNQNHRLLQQITVSGEINDELAGIALENGGGWC